MKWVLIYLIVISSLSCARERSKESRQREEAERTLKRISDATGIYRGYLMNSKSTITPVELKVQVVKNPSNEGETPLLSAGLHMGLFGGVTIASTSAFYDWGAKELVVSFGQKTEGADQGKEKAKTAQGLELRGIINGDKFENGLLLGPHIGRQTLVLGKGAANLTHAQTEATYNIHWDKGGDHSLASVLEIKTKAINQQAPATSDLPYLPGIDASIKFDTLAAAQQSITAALYDPTTATLDLQFTDYSWFRVANVALDAKTHEFFLHRGTLYLSGIAVQGFTLTRAEKPNQMAKYPPATFLGTYRGSQTSLKYKAVVYLDFLQGVGANKPDLPLPSFPNMRLELDICNGDQVLQQSVFKLDTLDILSRRAVFHRLETEQDPLEVAFGPDWSIDGAFFQTDAHEGGQKPKVWW